MIVPSQLFVWLTSLFVCEMMGQINNEIFFLICSIEWSAVIVDEAHRIKNPKAQITQTMKSLKCSVRIGLTGTILQNNMKELWCVMDW